MANKYLQTWHWLATGSNATAVATVTAILAFIGLWFYTVYTRRMMLVAQETRRAETYPYFVIRGQVAGLQHIGLELMNIGGHAAKVEGWGQSVSKQFRLASIYLERKTGTGSMFYGAIIKDQTLHVKIFRHAAATRTLMVLDCTDTRQGKHQFTILVNWDDEQGQTVEATMVQPDVFLPFWKRWATRIRAMIFLNRQQHNNDKG